jgi:hypothetical protein
MNIERTERVHQHAAQDNVLTVSKARQGYPTDDMSRVVVTDRKVLVAIKREGPTPGLPVSTLTAVLEPEDAIDLGAAIAGAGHALAREIQDDPADGAP